MGQLADDDQHAAHGQAGRDDLCDVLVFGESTRSSGTGGDKVNGSGALPSACRLADSDADVTPNEGNAVEANVRGQFFIARNDSTPLAHSSTRVTAQVWIGIAAPFVGLVDGIPLRTP